MHTSARDEALINEIADYFDMLASDCEAMLKRGFGSKRETTIRARVLREAAADVRSIKLVDK